MIRKEPMLIEEIKNIKCGKGELRRFGISLSIVLCLLGGIFFLRGKDYYHYFFILSPVFLLLGLLAPVALKPLYKIWMSLGTFIGWLATNTILIALFYFVLTPIGFIARLFGEDFLKLKLDKNAVSYWIPRKELRFEKSDYERQF